MDTKEVGNQDLLEKTVSFKIAKDELAIVKAQCEEEGITMSEFFRKRIQNESASGQAVVGLRRELEANYEAKLANGKIGSLENELTQVRQELVLSKEKRKKLKKQVSDFEIASKEREIQDEGGLGGLVTTNPALRGMLGDVLVKVLESPKIQHTIGALMGVPDEATELSESDKAWLEFIRDLQPKLSQIELNKVLEVCTLMAEHKALIPRVAGYISGTLKAKVPVPTNTPVGSNEQDKAK